MVSNTDCAVVFFLRLVHPMLPVSLDCPFLTAPSVFSNVNLLKIKQNLLVIKNEIIRQLLFFYVIKHPMTKSRECNEVKDSAMIIIIVIA